MGQFTTPIALFVYNRPETTSRVLERIAKVKPRTLLLIADGPKDMSEQSVCLDTRQLVETVSWECNIERNYSDTNLGVIQRFTTGLDWVFENHENAIILEDDTLPEESFFYFCAHLLERYKDDSRIMLISGQCMNSPKNPDNSGYFFSKFALIWGWATWRDSWRRFHIGMDSWRYLRETRWLASLIPDPVLAEYWRKSFDRAIDGNVGTWDYQWMYIFFLCGGFSIVPNVNQVSNIGFGPNSVNTKDIRSPNSNMNTFPITFPLNHPVEISIDKVRDDATAERLWKSRYLQNNRIVRFEDKIYE